MIIWNGNHKLSSPVLPWIEPAFFIDIFCGSQTRNNLKYVYVASIKNFWKISCKVFAEPLCSRPKLHFISECPFRAAVGRRILIDERKWFFFSATRSGIMVPSARPVITNGRGRISGTMRNGGRLWGGGKRTQGRTGTYINAAREYIVVKSCHPTWTKKRK